MRCKIFQVFTKTSMAMEASIQDVGTLPTAAHNTMISKLYVNIRNHTKVLGTMKGNYRQDFYRRVAAVLI